MDGLLRAVGTFNYEHGDVVVTGFETGGDPIVRRSQFIGRFDKTGQLESRVIQPMEFELIEESTFRQMATDTGFEVKAVFGDYNAQIYDPQSSPVMIWELQKKWAS